MPDAPPSTPLPETLAALRLEASLLQGFQSTMAILGAMPLVEFVVRKLHMDAPVPLTRLRRLASVSRGPALGVVGVRGSPRALRDEATFTG